MKVDHRKISVATTMMRPLSPVNVPQVPAVVEGETKKSGPQAEPSRTRGLYFEDVQIRGSRAKGSACKVTLRRGDERFIGEAEGYESDRSRVELSARATLAAIQLGGGELTL